MITDDQVMVAGVTPDPQCPTLFLVPSSRVGHLPHHVDLDYNGKPACSCEDSMARERECKHIRMVFEYLKQHELSQRQ